MGNRGPEVGISCLSAPHLGSLHISPTHRRMVVTRALALLLCWWAVSPPRLCTQASSRSLGSAYMSPSSGELSRLLSTAVDLLLISFIRSCKWKAVSNSARLSDIASFLLPLLTFWSEVWNLSLDFTLSVLFVVFLCALVSLPQLDWQLREQCFIFVNYIYIYIYMYKSSL